MYNKIIYFLLLCIFSVSGIYAQNNHPKRNSSIKITTKTRPLPTLAEQVTYLEKQVAWAKKQPSFAKDGTLAKYEKALTKKQAALRLEEEERAYIAQQRKNKKK